MANLTIKDAFKALENIDIEIIETPKKKVNKLSEAVKTKKLKEAEESEQSKVADFIKDAVEGLKKEEATNYKYDLDGLLGLFVGWSAGYGEEKRDDCIQSEENPDYAINVGIKIKNPADWAEFDYLNFPYHENGEVEDLSISIEPDEDYNKLAQYVLEMYDGVKDLDIDDDGLIVEKDKLSLKGRMAKEAQPDPLDDEIEEGLNHKVKGLNTIVPYNTYEYKGFILGVQDDGTYKIKDYKYKELGTAKNKKEAIKFVDDFISKNEIEEGLKEEKLQEKNWKYSLKSGLALRKAINDEDFEEIKKQLLNCYKELFKNQLIDEDDYDTWTEEIIDSDFDTDDEVDYHLSNLYDLCDNINVWVELFESKKPLSNKKIDSIVKRNQKYLDHIKIKPNSKSVEVEIPDNSKAGDEGHPIQQGLRGRTSKLEAVEEPTDMKSRLDKFVNKNMEVEESCELKEEPQLEPIHDGRKSFYGKADWHEEQDGTKVLYSYDTKVCEITPDGKVKLLSGSTPLSRGYKVALWRYSPTTLRHVKEFLKQNGFKADSVKQMEKDYLGESLNEAPDKYGLPTDDELEKEYTDKKANLDNKRKQFQNIEKDFEDACKEFKEKNSKKLAKLYKDFLKGKILFLGKWPGRIDDEYVVCFYNFKESLHFSIKDFNNDIYIDIKTGDISCEYPDRVDYEKFTKVINHISDNFDKYIELIKKYNEEETNKCLKQYRNLFSNAQNIDAIRDISGPDHWAHGCCFIVFSAFGKIFRYEEYDSGAYTHNHVHEIKCFNLIKPEKGRYDEHSPIVAKINPEDTGLIVDKGGRGDNRVGGKIDINKLKNINESLTEGTLVNINDDEEVKKGIEKLEDKTIEPESEKIVDVDADTVEKVKDSYIGNVILQCPVCRTLIYKEPEKLIKDEETELYNLEDECPHCGSVDGFELVGQVAKADVEIKDEESEEVKPEELPVEEPVEEVESDEEEIKFESLDTDKLDTLLNRYMHEVYSNIDNYNTTSANVDDENNQIIVEGKIKFNSGKEKTTKFVFEAHLKTVKGKYKFKGLNETFSKNKSFTLTTTIDDNMLIPESFWYNYKINQLNESKQIKGSVRL